MPYKIRFGTDGWRGLMDSEVNDTSVAAVAQSFADYLLKLDSHPSVAVGFDGRKNSNRFADIFTRVLVGNGITSFLSDTIVPTPVVSFYIKKNQLSAGVMITASHNPPQYNGIKFKGNYGGPFFTEETKKVEELLFTSEVKITNDCVSKIDFTSDYFAHLKNIFNMELIAKSNLSVLVDSMGGAGNSLLQKFLSNYGCNVKTIFAEPAEDFNNRLPEPIEKNLSPLSEALVAGSYSLGLATDGDADRLGIMTGNGKWVSAQETILLLADYLTNSRKATGGIAKTSSVTDKIHSICPTKTKNIYDVQVGFKFLCEKMLQEEIAFAAEESGGFGFNFHIPERDGIVSALLVLEMLAHSGITSFEDFLNEKRKLFGHVYYDRIDVEYKEDDRIEILPSLWKRNIDSIAEFKVIKRKSFLSSSGVINGIKFILEGSPHWILIRASETEPLVRVYAEGESQYEVQMLLKSGFALFQNESKR